MDNPILKSVQAEIASSKPLERTPDRVCRTLEKFYDASKDERKALRECSSTPSAIHRTIMARTKTGEKTAAAIVSKAMKNTKEKMPQIVYEGKEEKVDGNKSTTFNLPPKKSDYPDSVSEKYLSYLPAPMDVVDRGISLKGLQTILEEYQKNEKSFENFKANRPEISENIRCPGENLTHMLVKPETRICDCYIEYLYAIFNRCARDAKTEKEVKFIEKESDDTLGKVNVFVSHTWQYKFEKLVGAIRLWEKNWEKVNGTKHETFYYFVDYFAVNQHNQEGDLLKLQEVVKNSKVTCLVLDPWDKPKPLLRCWCIYEIAKTALFPSTRLNVAFPPDQVKSFKKNFFDEKGVKVRGISRRFEFVDSEKARASYKLDEERIKEDIKLNLGGFHKVNKLCIRILRKWLIEQACEFADAESRGDFYNQSNNEINEVAHADRKSVV